MHSTSTFFAILLAASSSFVSGHGIIKNVVINGKTYPGALGPGSDPSNSPVRAVASGDPIFDVTSSDMACGTNSQLAPISAVAAPGDTIQVSWQAETGINWFHNVGPTLAYMAKCSGDCKTYKPDGSTQWFKITAQGLKAGSDTSGLSSTDWIQAEMNNGSPLPVTIPSDLSDGNYLLRHEIIALQNGQTKDKAEFYPNCIQMTISGGKNGNSDAAQNITPMTTFPGAYKDTDAGIFVDVYNPGLNYKMPGPAIANIAQGSSGSAPESGSAPGSSSAPANVAPTPTPVPSAASSSAAPVPTSSSTGNSTSTCKKRRGNNSKRMEKRALRTHAKRRVVQVSY